MAWKNPYRKIKIMYYEKKKKNVYAHHIGF